MKLTNKQIKAIGELYNLLDKDRDTIYISEFIKADRKMESLIHVLHELEVSLEDFEKISGIK